MNETNTALVDLAGGVFPLFLVKALLSKIHSQVHVELQADQNDLILTTLEERDEALLDSLKSIELSSVIRAYLEQHLRSDRLGRSNTLKIDRFIELSPHGNAQLRSLLNGDVLSHTRPKLLFFLELVQTLGTGIYDLDRKLAGTPDIDSIATIREEIGQVKKMLEESRIKLAALNLEEKRLASKKDELQGKWIRHLQN
ncbi:MAG: hypothetical protein IPK01_00655 [Acidobacteria bacterium]|nr:hypothetical protein [Acidobacteriota bacterium]